MTRNALDELMTMSVAVGASGALTVSVTGEVDASNAALLRDGIVLHAARAPGTEVAIDLGNVTFMDSSGLRAMADAALQMKVAGSSLVLCHVPSQIERILTITEPGASLAVRG